MIYNRKLDLLLQVHIWKIKRGENKTKYDQFNFYLGQIC